MQEQATISGAPDVAASTPSSADSSPAQTTTASTSSADVQTQAVQSETQQTTPSADDPFAGIPTQDELQELVKQNIPHAKAVAQLRSALESRNTQFTELESKYKPFESHLERFERPEQLESAVKLQDSLFGYARDDQNQLVPATETFAQELATRDPLVADYLAADLMNGTTRDPDTGQTVPRIDLALQEMARDPSRRATALKILGGVEPSSIAPTWQPSAEELEVVRPELQDIYKGLPYDDRESLKMNDPAFINKYLADQKFKDDLISENRQAKEHEQREVQRREQYMQQRAQEAGNSFVETGFRTGMTEFTNSIVEKSQFIAPIDPNSEAAKAMDPNQLTQFNQSAQRINTGVGKFIATITAALAVPDTAWFAGDFLKELGVDPTTIQKFDEARQNYANNARNYGELNFQLTGGQPRNGGSVPEGLTSAQYQASQAMKSMKGYGNLVSQSLMKLFSEFFEMKAGSYNAQLNGSGTVRPQVNGSHFDPTTAPANLPAGPMSRAEIERLYG